MKLVTPGELSSCHLNKVKLVGLSQFQLFQTVIYLLVLQLLWLIFLFSKVSAYFFFKSNVFRFLQ